jgi:hypothetical protein
MCAEKIDSGGYVFGHCPAANRWGTPSTLDPPGQPPGRSYRHQGAMGQWLGAALAGVDPLERESVSMGAESVSMGACEVS